MLAPSQYNLLVIVIPLIFLSISEQLTISQSIHHPVLWVCPSATLINSQQWLVPHSLHVSSLDNGILKHFLLKTGSSDL